MVLDVGGKILTSPPVKAAGRELVNNLFRRGSGPGSSLIDNQGNEKNVNDSIEIKNSANERANTNNATHASRREHNVKGHGQHYNTKEGPIWKDKEPYSRGKKDESI